MSLTLLRHFPQPRFSSEEKRELTANDFRRMFYLDSSDTLHIRAPQVVFDAPSVQVKGDQFSLNSPNSQASIKLDTSYNSALTATNRQGRWMVGLHTDNPSGGTIRTLNQRGNIVTQLDATDDGYGELAIHNSRGGTNVKIEASAQGGKVRMSDGLLTEALSIAADDGAGNASLSASDLVLNAGGRAVEWRWIFRA
jgi:hypothetical protein